MSFRRKSFAAGSWFPDNPNVLRSVISDLFLNYELGPGIIPFKNNEKRTIIGGISPNAGYRYSGYATAHTFYQLFKERRPDTVVILCPDLFGILMRNQHIAGLMSKGIWETPLGDLTVDSELAKAVLGNDPDIKNYTQSFLNGPIIRDQSIEIQLPFIKFCSYDKDIKILPLIICSSTSYEKIKKIALNISPTLSGNGKDVIIIAVATMLHVTASDPVKVRTDYLLGVKKSISEILNNNPLEAFNSMKTITGNGTQTITFLMSILNNIGTFKAKSLLYYTTDDLSYIQNISASPGYTVGYFSGIFQKGET